jgi:prepilin-type N-terminal cleavage/methylation domain-containing protein
MNYGKNVIIKQMLKTQTKNAFTLIELLVIIAIIGLLSSIILTSVATAREKARETVAFAQIKELQEAIQEYDNDIGYYPPDVNRGWDPGFVKPLPYDTSGSGADCNTNQGACTCGNYLPCTGSAPPGMPSNWISVVQSSWRGPYIAQWPTYTPWGGLYDYNYWTTPMPRGSCGNINPYMTPQGMYLGIESGSGFTMTPAVEQELFNDGLDNDGCPDNGEAQLLLLPL